MSRSIVMGDVSIIPVQKETWGGLQGIPFVVAGKTCGVATISVENGNLTGCIYCDAEKFDHLEKEILGYSPLGFSIGAVTLDHLISKWTVGLRCGNCDALETMTFDSEEEAKAACWASWGLHDCPNENRMGVLRTIYYKKVKE